MYKRAIVHFRTLYALARALPAHALCRKAAEGKLDAPVAVEIEVSSAPSENLGDHKTWALEGVQTPAGTLSCQVQYRACTELRIERRGTATPCADAALPTPPSGTLPVASRLPTTAAPAFARRRPPRGALAGDALAVPVPGEGLHEQSSPLLRRMWPAHEVSSPQSAPIRPRRFSNASEPTSADGLRTLFQTYTPPRTHVGRSPSSLYSLRLSPQGHFDSHMRRRAETTSSVSAQESAQPVRIPRYARQPSYRQREHSRSLGGAADELSTSARSWSQRMEQRRMMERGAARDSLAQLPRSPLSSSGSRLFANTAPSQAPAFALAKPPPPPPEPADDLLELVQMLDAPPALHEPDARRSLGVSLGRSPGHVAPAPRAEKIDDVLARLGQSIHLPAMDERFGELERHAVPRAIQIAPRHAELGDQDALDLAY